MENWYAEQYLSENDKIIAARHVTFKMIDGLQMHQVKRDNDVAERLSIRTEAMIREIFSRQEYDALCRKYGEEIW